VVLLNDHIRQYVYYHFEAPMKRVPATLVPSISLDAAKHTPLYRQLYEWFRTAIAEGRLRPGQRIPSTRSLAKELQISRIPVLNAYEQLHTEGYLQSVVGAGTCVASSLVEETLRPRALKARRNTRTASGAPRPLSERGLVFSRPTPQPSLSNLGAFRVNLPAVDQFPLNAWTQLVIRHARKMPKEIMAYGDAMGYLPLREAIAEYLGMVRAVRCDASQIVVTTGSQQALQLTAQVLLDPNDTVCVEDPGYPGARLAFMTAGARLVPIPVNGEGLNVEALIRKAPDAKAVYITPSHQYPLGMTMSATQRLRLLDWATRAGAWIIEDDYDSEYRFSSRPIGSLQGMDADARVIYAGTFSKVLFPALRLGYVVVPKDLVSAFSGALDAAGVFSSPLYQTVLTDFIREGHFARHIRRMRMLYMERRQALVKAMRMHLGDRFEIVGAEAGMHLSALLPPGINDAATVRNAASRGVSTMPLSACYWSAPIRGGLILGFGGTNEHQIREGVRKLKGL
jgi:GntR family transcriptional regulator/MocR family aminotransferase